jgi:Tfp pilus assembly protein PilV
MNRRAITLLEVMVAGVLVGAITVLCLQVLGAATTQRRAVETEQTAVREAANLMERLTVTPWADLTPQGTEQVRLSQEALQSLPDADLQINVTTTADQPPAKRIDLSLRWQNRNGQPQRHVELVAWVYAAASDTGRGTGGEGSGIRN